LIILEDIWRYVQDSWELRKGEDDNGILWNLKGFGDWVRVDLKENQIQ